MIISFHDTGTEDIFHERPTKAARRTCPESVWPIARRKLGYLNLAERLSDLRNPSGNKLHALTKEKERMGQHAIRINDAYRVCFRWTDVGAADVEITDYH